MWPCDVVLSTVAGIVCLEHSLTRPTRHCSSETAHGPLPSAPQVLHQREEVLPYLRQQLTALAARHGERLLDTPGNPISTALTLDTLVAASAAAKQRAAEATAAAAAAAVAAAAPVAVEAGQEGMAGAASGLNGVAGKKAGTSAAAPDVTFFGSMLWQR